MKVNLFGINRYTQESETDPLNEASDCPTCARYDCPGMIDLYPCTATQKVLQFGIVNRLIQTSDGN
jgi:hypothetical protein